MREDVKGREEGGKVKRRGENVRRKGGERERIEREGGS